jgi:hypothetical protein
MKNTRFIELPWTDEQVEKDVRTLERVAYLLATDAEYLRQSYRGEYLRRERALLLWLASRLESLIGGDRQ